MRAIWSGEIAFGLVAIPVKLYSATRDLAPHFHYIHKKCGTRIETVRRCPHCEVDVPWKDIDKGYEVEKGKYARFTKEELDEVGGDTKASGIDIAEFVDASSVDRAYVEKSYWVGPAGKTTRGYELLRSALEKSGKAAIAKVAIRTRTRLGLLRPREGRFSLDMMRFGDELVDGGEIEVAHSKQAASPRELHLALGLIDQLTAKSFDPKRHPDDYRAAVSAAVEKKIEEGEVAEDEAPSSSRRGSKGRSVKMIDLADMLSRSLEGAKRPAKKRAPAAAAKTGKRKAAAGGRKATVHHLHGHKKAS